MSRLQNPFRGFLDTISETNRQSQQWMTGSGVEAGQENQERTHATAWIPLTDIFVRGVDLVIRCELPGVEREDMEITVSKDTLTITGNRRADPEGEDDASFYVRERSWGIFRRTMTLPEGISESDIDAELNRGLLEVVIQNGASAARPRQIRVKDEPE
ncbi:MAG: Hsp20/alpha crystallin family protein [Rubrobacter sp.]|jgi:HSP20 family protein|nr:Hsp20/alpha crystallin family protein [Rubrobacter sp.]